MMRNAPRLIYSMELVYYIPLDLGGAGVATPPPPYGRKFYQK